METTHGPSDSDVMAAGAVTPATPRAPRSTAPRGGGRSLGRVYRRPNSSVFWCRYYYAGQDHRESTGETDEKKAQKYLGNRLDEIGADRQGLRKFIAPAAQRVTVKELIDSLQADYTLRGGRALAQFLAHLRPIREVFGHRRAISVSTMQVDAYITARLTGQRPMGAIDTPNAKKPMNWRKAAKPATVNRETQLLGQAMRLGVERQCLAT